MAEQKKIIFDHLPKCGGTSLFHYVQGNFEKDRIFRLDGIEPYDSILKFRNMSRPRRHYYDFISGHYARMIFRHASPNCWRVTIFREPVYRIVSHYYYALRNRSHYLHERLNCLNIPLAKYHRYTSEARNWYTTYLSGLELSAAEQNPDTAINLALANVHAEYHLVGFMDGYEQFCRQLETMTEIEVMRGGAKYNVGKYPQPLDREVYDIISEMNFLDVKLYERLREQYGKQL